MAAPEPRGSDQGWICHQQRCRWRSDGKREASPEPGPNQRKDLRDVPAGGNGRRWTQLAPAGRLARVPMYNSSMRTTCVATMLQAGHAENALPQRAQATIQCRLLPDESPERTRATLLRVLADSVIKVKL